MPPPITSGLLWSTDDAIDYAKTGPEIPPIPLNRAAGPVYCAISVRIDAAEGVIFRVGNPEDDFFSQRTFTLNHWGDAYQLDIAPGWPNQVIGQVSPGFPDELVLEFWLSADGSDFVDHQQFGWLNPDMPDADVAASTHLFFGYRLSWDGVSPDDRGAGSINRMALFDRVPSPAERAQIVDWVQSQGDPPVEGDLAATGASTSSSISARVGIVGSVASVDPADVPTFAASVAWPGVQGSLGAIGPASKSAILGAVALSGGTQVASSPDTFEGLGAVSWPGLSADLAARDALDVAEYSASIQVRGSLSAYDPPDIAAISGGATWAAVNGAMAAAGPSSTADAVATVEVSAVLSATDAPGNASILAGAAWPPLGAHLNAAGMAGGAALAAAMAVRAELAAVDPPDAILVWAGTGWQPISGDLLATSAPDIMASEAAVGLGGALEAAAGAAGAALGAQLAIAGGLAAASAPSALQGLIGAGWPQSSAALSGSDEADVATATFGVSAQGLLVAASPMDAFGAWAEVSIRASMLATSLATTAAVREKDHLVSERYAYPGPRDVGAVLNANRPAGSILNRPRGRGEMSEVR